MKDPLRLLVLFVGWMVTSLSGTTALADPSILKCNSNKDQVWVYDSLTNFGIETKLNCGETVEVTESLKDFVKIRARNGVVGYVPDSQISELPAFNDPTPDVGTVANQVQAREIAMAAESKPIFIVPKADSRPASTKKPNVGGPVVTPLAEINPDPFSSPAKKTSRDLSSETLVNPPPEVTGPATTDLSAHSDIAASDLDESPVLKVSPESVDPACQSYFSAYGLTIGQLKWIVQNRKKMFPSVCPAPHLSEVNFVFIFTHDVDFFSTTMPEPVHNMNGFSDFHALSTIDEADASANKAHREYVWIFRFARGDFNPEDFSQRRRYQFSKVESNTLGSGAGPKAVEDAFRFAEATNR